MKTIKFALILCTSIFLFSSCQRPDKLVGKWERIGDQYEGLQLEVSQIGNVFVGKLIHITETGKHFGLELS
jgi:hypothetical protein